MKIKAKTTFVSDEGFEFTFRPMDDGLTIEKTKDGYEARYLVQDDNADSPKEWADESLFLVADHRDFCVKPIGNSTFETVTSDYKNTHYIFGLEAYIHSGVVLALSQEGNFPDRNCDTSQLGAVFVSKKEWPDKAAARDAALGLIKTWNMYLCGDVYGIVKETYDHDKNHLHQDSCWGFYGHKDALEALKTEI